MDADSQTISDLLAVNDLVYSGVSEEDKARIPDLVRHLNNSSYNPANASEDPSAVLARYYKVPFTEALDLVRSRKCYVNNGFCFVEADDMIHLLVHIFKTLLNQGKQNFVL